MEIENIIMDVLLFLRLSSILYTHTLKVYIMENKINKQTSLLLEIRISNPEYSKNKILKQDGISDFPNSIRHKMKRFFS